MKRSIINIAQTSQLSWHPLTSALYESYIHCFDNDYIKKLSEIGESHYPLIPQTIYFVADSKSQSKARKGSVNTEVRNYQIIAGVFNPWFVENSIKHRKSQHTLICLLPDKDETKDNFEQAIARFIVGDYFNAISSANMPFVGSSYFGMNTIETDIAKQFFIQLTGDKLIAENYAKFFGITRDAVYKQFEKSKLSHKDPNKS